MQNAWDGRGMHRESGGIARRKYDEDIEAAEMKFL
jgi:hypothetical protein